MKKIVISILAKFDKLIVKLAGWNHIPNSKSNFMYISIYKFIGRSITLRDGTLISKGDWIAELHIDNTKIKMIDTSYHNLIKLFKEELLVLKQNLKNEPYSKIKAIYGITVFYSIASRQGFTVRNVSNPLKNICVAAWENILRIAFKKPTGKARNKFVISKECWLSRGQILAMK